MNSDLQYAKWRKASYSAGNDGNCVEVALTATVTGIRDSKAPEGGYLQLGRSGWSAFVANVKSGLGA